jgi:hypothetical protein
MGSAPPAVSRKLIARDASERILRLQKAAQAAAHGEQDRIAGRRADGCVQLLEAVEIDQNQGRADFFVGLREFDRGIEAIEEQLAVRQAGEIVVHRILQQPLLGDFEFGDVVHGADDAKHLAVGTDHGPRAQREPEIVPVLGLQPQRLDDAATAMIEDRVEREPDTVAIGGMHEFEPGLRLGFHRAALETEHQFGFGAHEDAVADHVPVPDGFPGAGDRKRAALDVAHEAFGRDASKGVLHDGKADQHHDELETAEQCGGGKVVADCAGNDEAGRDHPDRHQEPGRDQEHRTVEAVGRKIEHEAEACDRDDEQREPRDAGCNRGIEQRERNESREEDEPGCRHLRIAHVPAAEI